MTRFGWVMSAVIVLIVLVVGFFWWTGISEHIPPQSLAPNPIVPVASAILEEETESDGAAHDAVLPLAVDVARNSLAATLSVDPWSILIVSSLPTDWPDSCLGLPKEGELCIQAITSGYEVMMLKDGAEYVYRTDVDGTIVRTKTEQ